MRRFHLLIAAALSLCWLSGVFQGSADAQSATPVDRALSSGLGFGAGVGSDNVFVGGHVIYYLQLREPRLRVALHVGAGALPQPLYGPPLWGMTGGSFLSFGRRNRLVVGLIGGTMSWATFDLHGERLAARQMLGMGVCAGWELMTRRGFFVRGSLGPGFAVQREVPLEEREADFAIVASTSLGYKPW